MRKAIIAPQKKSPMEHIRIGLLSIQVSRVAPSSRIQANSWEKISSMSVIVPEEPAAVSAARAGNAKATAITPDAQGTAPKRFTEFQNFIQKPPF